MCYTVSNRFVRSTNTAREFGRTDYSMKSMILCVLIFYKLMLTVTYKVISVEILVCVNTLNSEYH